MEEEFMKIEGVKEVHDLHVWSISTGKHSLSAHIKAEDPLKALKMVTEMCQKKFNIDHTTIQVEGLEHDAHQFECQNIH